MPRLNIEQAEHHVTFLAEGSEVRFVAAEKRIDALQSTTQALPFCAPTEKTAETEKNRLQQPERQKDLRTLGDRAYRPPTCS